MFCPIPVLQNLLKATLLYLINNIIMNDSSKK